MNGDHRIKSWAVGIRSSSVFLPPLHIRLTYSLLESPFHTQLLMLKKLWLWHVKGKGSPGAAPTVGCLEARLTGNLDTRSPGGTTQVVEMTLLMPRRCPHE